MMQPGFFDLDNRHQKLDEKDPLIQLNQLIDWEQFRVSLKPIRSGPKKITQAENPTI
jgi:hypothetical protein